MDPAEVLKKALTGDQWAKKDYNEWIKSGGAPATVKAFIDQVTPQLLEVDYLGPELVRGTCGLVFPHREYVKYDRVLASTVR